MCIQALTGDSHAGYSYCGGCGAFAYKQVDSTNVYDSCLLPQCLVYVFSCLVRRRKRVFILGPSHHVYLSGCALSSTTAYETPLYNLNIDQSSESTHSLVTPEVFSLRRRQMYKHPPQGRTLIEINYTYI